MSDNRNPMFMPRESWPSTASFALVPDHELVRLIGRGSYGEVWLAKSTLGPWRAVKIVYENTFTHKRPFEREFKGVQKFEPVSRLHEGLMDVLQVGHNAAAGYFYCVMELADDVFGGQVIDPDRYAPRTLAHDLAKSKRLPIRECQRIGIAIASALDFMHGRGLIHRDVKPSNIVFVNGAPKLADIGLVAEVSEARSYVGTEGFIPPEGPGTVQADIYSFGKVLYEISTGKDRHDYPELPTQLGDPVQERELIEFNKVVLLACRADPRERYKSATAMTADLLALARGEHLKTRSLRSWLSSPKLIKAAGFVAALGVMGGLVLWADHKTGSPAAPGQSAASTLESEGISAPTVQGLVAWWPGEGNAEDSAGVNAAALMSGVVFRRGMVGQGFYFVDKWGQLLLADPAALNFGPDASFTIEAWIKAERETNDVDIKPIISKYQVSGQGTELGYELYLQGGELAFQFGDAPLRENGSVSIVSQAPYLEDGRFHHVAVVLDRRSRTGGQLCVDGAVVVQFDPTVRPGDLSNLEPLRIGAGRARKSVGFFKGTIDEPAIYDRALTLREIHTIYSAGNSARRELPATILRQPSSRSVQPGANVVFNVAAAGSPVLQYQWFRDGTNRVQSVGRAMTLCNVQSEDAGLYSVRATNAFGSVLSSDAVLRVDPGAVAGVAPPPGLLAWWKAEGNGNDSAGTNHALLSNGAGFGPGKVGEGFHLDAVEGRIMVPNSPALNFGSNQNFSIEAWIKPLPAITTYGVMSIVDKRWQTNLSRSLGYEFSLENGRLHFHFSDSEQHPFSGFGTPGPDMRDGQFHHVAVTVVRHSSTGGRLYVDGQAVLTFDPTSQPGDLSNAEPLRIGHHANSEFECGFKGVIDEVSIYNRALSPAEVQDICHAGRAGKRAPAGLAQADSM